MISIDSGICTCMLVMKTKAAVRKTIDIGVKHSIENIDNTLIEILLQLD